MRNLKKLFAVIMTVAMLASIMVPALAADSFKFEGDARKLYDLGLFKGTSETSYVPDLGTALTRETGLALMIRAMGKDEEALAMTQAEVAEYLAKVVDKETINPWAEPYVAYAVKNGLTNGIDASILPNIKFGGQLPLSGKEFIFFMLKAMGYDSDTVPWDDVLNKAVEIGMLTPGQAVTFGSAPEIIRDDAIGIIAGAMAGTTASGVTLAQALVDAGVIAAEDMVAAGYLEETAIPTPTPEPLAIVSVTAKKVNILEVVFSKPVDTSDVTIAVKKGTSDVAISAPVWNADFTVATITTTAKMTNGVYTVNATSASDSSVATGTTEIKNQYVAEIKLLNEVALTNDDSTRAYIYYDVVDQYGESIRTSTSIEWSFSAQLENVNRTTGVITLKKNTAGNATFTYSEKIYVTGVYTKTGVTVTGTVSVGAKQAVNGVEIAGFVKKGTSDILSQLPAGFKAGTYYMIYKVTDQNGNPMTATNPVTNNDITFISDNVLVIKELAATGETVLTVNGEEYNAVFVTPGINVGTGGEVNITAIANKTGNKTVKNIVVGEDQILTSFTMSSPTAMIADGESVVIPFEALDQNGSPITNFTTLAKQASFNKLSFTASTGSLVLAEKADGTAELKYNDITMPWSDSQTTDGIDRTVSLTSVVVGGTTSSILLYIQDKARPDAISAVDMDNVLVEKGSTTVNLTKFTFIDQYGRTMSKKDAINDVANGFFKASKDGYLMGTDFAGYEFAVRATFKGDAGYFFDDDDDEDGATGPYAPVGTPGAYDAAAEALDPDSVREISTVLGHQTFVLSAIANKVTSAKSGFSIKFEIVKYLATQSINGASAQAISTVKNEPLTIVDVKAVSGYTVADLNKFFVLTDNSGAVTGDTGSTPLSTSNINSDITFSDADAAISSDYKQEVKVTGTYAGETVKIPAVYLEIQSNKLSTAGSDSTSPSVIDAVYTATGYGFKWSDFYDATTARYTRKDASDTIKVIVKDLDNSGETIDTISKAVAVSDATPKIATITGVDEITISPDLTKLSITTTAAASKVSVFGKDFEFKDQYGVKLATIPTYKVSSVVESTTGYADNNFKVSGNDTNTLSIVGAERGDKFVLTIKAGDVTKTVNIIVGADKKANITNSTNNYLDVLIGDPNDGLELQRAQGLN